MCKGSLKDQDENLSNLTLPVCIFYFQGFVKWQKFQDQPWLFQQVFLPILVVKKNQVGTMLDEAHGCFQK